mmetsp:Transcript_128015/g.410181  ORF Transcript_128015/g.410181 Transcript_128015/m.410181 type:complete len:418 (-) Transcript_128015:592-1845(-)
MFRCSLRDDAAPRKPIRERRHVCLARPAMRGGEPVPGGGDAALHLARASFRLHFLGDRRPQEAQAPVAALDLGDEPLHLHAQPLHIPPHAAEGPFHLDVPLRAQHHGLTKVLMQLLQQGVMVDDLGSDVLQGTHQHRHAAAQILVRAHGLHLDVQAVHAALHVLHPSHTGGRQLLAVEALAEGAAKGALAEAVERKRAGGAVVARERATPQGLRTPLLQSADGVAQLLVTSVGAIQLSAQNLELLHGFDPSDVEVVDARLDLPEAAVEVVALQAVREGPVLLLLRLGERSQRFEALLLGLDALREFVGLALQGVKRPEQVLDLRLHGGHREATSGDEAELLLRDVAVRVRAHCDGHRSLTLGRAIFDLSEPIVQLQNALVRVFGRRHTLLHQTLQAQEPLVVLLDRVVARGFVHPDR